MVARISHIHIGESISLGQGSVTFFCIGARGHVTAIVPIHCSTHAEAAGEMTV